MKGCNVCLASKTVWHKLYEDLQSFPTPIYCWKNLSIDFITGLPILIDWKGDNYDSILIIVDRLTKMVHYKLVKVSNNALGLAKVIINVVMRHHGLPDLIITNQGSFFILKFWSSICYFLGIKRRLSIAFYPQTNGQTKRQNNTIEAYFRAFINFEQNNWAQLLLMAKFAYNNAKNASTGYILFKFYCGYYPQVSFKEDLDPCSKSKTAEKLSSELQNLMAVCQQNLLHA